MTFQSSIDCITENKLRKIYQSHEFFCFFVLCEFTSRRDQNMGDQEASTAYLIAYMKTNKLLLQSYVSHLETTEEHENPSVISIGDVPGMLPKWCIMSCCFSVMALLLLDQITFLSAQKSLRTLHSLCPAAGWTFPYGQLGSQVAEPSQYTLVLCFP